MTQEGFGALEADREALTLPGMPRRSRLRRRVLLAIDPFMALANDSWVGLLRLADRADKGSFDPETGRTTAEALERGHLGNRIERVVAQAREAGLDEPTLMAAVDEGRLNAANLIADRLLAGSPAMLRDHRARDRRLLRRLRAVWGEAFDSFYAIYVGLEEFGANLQTLYGATEDSLNQALLGLHARTCLLLAETHALMVLGYPHGAHARARSLYETAVVADVLRHHARTPGTDDLADRFLQHPVADQKRDLDRLRDCGYAVDPAEVAQVEQELEAMVAKYGPMFRKDYGWAHPLFPNPKKKSISFADLDSLDHDRLLDRADYRQAGHHVHSSAWSVVLNQYDRDGATLRLTGSTNVGFGEPARVALVAGVDSGVSLLGGLDPEPDEVHRVMLGAIEQLIERALAMFDEAEAYIWDRETRYGTRS